MMMVPPGGFAIAVLVLLPTALAGLGPANPAKTIRAENEAADTKSKVEWYGLVDVVEDGRKLEDEFELWTLDCDRPVSDGKCTLVVTSFITSGDVTHAFHWLHQTMKVQPVLEKGAYRHSMNGRLSDCSGLELTLKVDSKGGVQQIEGTMLAGTKCQSIHRYQPDRTNRLRPVRPLYNGAVAWNTLNREK